MVGPPGLVPRSATCHNFMRQRTESHGQLVYIIITKAPNTPSIRYFSYIYVHYSPHSSPTQAFYVNLIDKPIKIARYAYYF